MNRILSKLVRPKGAKGTHLALVLAFSLFATACNDGFSPLGREEAASIDSTATLLSGIDDTAFRAAFRGISDYSYTRYSRTEQFDTDDYLVAFRETVHRSTAFEGLRQVDLQEEDSAGTFDFGLFDRFTSSNITAMDPVDLVPYLLPDEPPYLKVRNQSKYEWSFLPDTLLWDTQAKVIEVKARRLQGDGENIRVVRHYVDRTTNELIAMYLERIDLALLFREESQFFVHMRRAGDGKLVPHNTRFYTHIKTPFETDSKFRTVSTYYDLERLTGQEGATQSAAEPPETQPLAAQAEATLPALAAEPGG
ncbi:MAG: hypothetical protein ACI80V_000252 [Rhodothermales bacterium]|jgi:hypothetical protein